MDIASGLACYLIEHGNDVKDGDTVGGDESERIVARLTTSENFSGMPVLRLVAG